MSGMVVGCDLLHMDPVKGAVLFRRRDFTDPKTQQEMVGALGTTSTGAARKFDVVLSDMSPNASGSSQLDAGAITHLSYLALRFAVTNGHRGSHFVTKIWEEKSCREHLIKDAKLFYQQVEVFKPKASRSESSETYVVAKHFKGLEEK